jgi:polar amino acid transport system substrate-binding protein
MLVKKGQVSGGFTGAIACSNKSDFFWHQTPLSVVRLLIWARTNTQESDLTAEDLEGQRVSITRGFFYTDAVDQNDSIAKLIAPSDSASLKMLALGRSDYALVTERIGMGILRTATVPTLLDKVQPVGLIEEVPLRIFFSKAHPHGREAARLFQQGLEILIQNGEYNRLAKKWVPSPLHP